MRVLFDGSFVDLVFERLDFLFAVDDGEMKLIVVFQEVSQFPSDGSFDLIIRSFVFGEILPWCLMGLYLSE